MSYIRKHNARKRADFFVPKKVMLEARLVAVPLMGAATLLTNPLALRAYIRKYTYF